MKTSAVLASVLFGSIAMAAPVDKRALAYKTEVVTETVVVWTTVYDDAGVAEATTTPAGYFYEQPKPSSAAAVPTPQAPSPVAPKPQPQQPSSQAPPVQAPSSQAPAPAPAPATSSQAPAPAAPTPTPTPTPAEQPKPQTSAYVAPAPAASSAAPAPQQPSGGSPTGQTYSGDITIYDNNGGFGACGTAIHDGDMIVALAKDAWGASTYDVMTGQATNPWCGQKIKVDYKGNSITATIMDLCPGCSGHDIDLSLAAWKALTGTDEKTRYQATWSKIS